MTGLMTGADDYVTKPFSPAELTARVDALYRRTGGDIEVDSGEISQPPFLLNTRNRTLEKNGQRVKLTQVEYSIMKLFMDNPGKALSRDEILDTVWGRDSFGELKTVDVNIRRLRIKIEDDPTNPTYITTVWGYGYKRFAGGKCRGANMRELEIFAERVRVLRKQRGMSQKELGEAIGLSHKSISTIESGSRTTTLEKLVMLARFFQVSTDYLLGLCEEPAPRA